LKWAKIPFEERLIRLDQPGYGEAKIAEVLSVSPNGRVPAVHHNGLIIWDSLAIAEWAAEQFPAAKLWPANASLRTQARSVTCEMHSGFAALRRDLSMNILRRSEVTAWPIDTQNDIDRMAQIWIHFRRLHADKGPYLFGERCLVDAFFTPVATRFRTYGVPLTTVLQDYSNTLLAGQDFKDWEAECIPNSWDQYGYSVIDGLHR
jgi:glutathione S-transferase